MGMAKVRWNALASDGEISMAFTSLKGGVVRVSNDGPGTIKVTFEPSIVTRTIDPDCSFLFSECFTTIEVVLVKGFSACGSLETAGFIPTSTRFGFGLGAQ